MNLLSIVIINFNTYELTCNCLKSIQQYTKIPHEIILLDNGSTECDPELFSVKFPEIFLLKSKVNLGFAKGNNEAIKSCNGTHILLLNSDTELIEDSITYCLDYLNHNQPSVVSCKLIYQDQTVQQQCHRFPSIKLNLIELFRVHKLIHKKVREKVMLSSYFDNLSFIKPDWIWGTFFMFKKDVLNKLPHNKLDETFFMYCEDMKWCYDFKKIGIDIVYLPQTKIIHHVGKSSSKPEFKAKNIILNELIFIKQTKGSFYKFFYGIVKSLNLLLGFTKEGKQYAKIILKNLIVFKQ